MCEDAEYASNVLSCQVIPDEVVCRGVLKSLGISSRIRRSEVTILYEDQYTFLFTITSVFYGGHH